MRGSELLLQCLSAEGVREVVGNPGTTELAWLDVLPAHKEVRYLLALHEDIAVGIADGYSAASGRVAVASVHATPGTAHALGNLYNAFMSGTPLVLLVGQQDHRLLAREPFLASRVEDALRPYTKWCGQVTRIEDLPLLLHRAFKVATDPPPGPVALVVPRDLYDEDVPPRAVEAADGGRIRAPLVIQPAPEAIELAADLLVHASSPALLCGPGGVRGGGSAVLRELAAEAGLAVYADPRYPLTFPTADDHYLGTFHGFPPGQHDVVLVVGQKVFLERTYAQVPLLPPGTLLIHSDSSPWEIGKNYPTTAPLPGTPRVTCELLVKAVSQRRRRDGGVRALVEARNRQVKRSHAEWRAQLDTAARAAWSRRPVAAERLACELDRVLPRDAALVVEATTHDAFLRDYYRLGPERAWFSEVGGSLGWGVPAAIGVKLATPQRPVVAVVGDGSFLYYPQALWTARRYGLVIVVVLCNNGSYLNDKIQLRDRGGPVAASGDYASVDIRDPAVDYGSVGHAFDVPSRRVEDPDALGDALLWALSQDRSVVVDVLVDPWQARA